MRVGVSARANAEASVPGDSPSCTASCSSPEATKRSKSDRREPSNRCNNENYNNRMFIPIQKGRGDSGILPFLQNIVMQVSF